jgi:hypothetical protein
MITIFFLLPCFLHMDGLPIWLQTNKNSWKTKNTGSHKALFLHGWALTSFHLLGWCLRHSDQVPGWMFYTHIWMKDMNEWRRRRITHVCTKLYTCKYFMTTHTLIYLLLLSGVVARAHTQTYICIYAINKGSRTLWSFGVLAALVVILVYG